MQRILSSALFALCACSGATTSSTNVGEQAKADEAGVAPQGAPAELIVERAPEQVRKPLPPWPGGYGPRCGRYKSISTIDLVSCAVCDDGRVHCWGGMSSGVLAGHAGRSFSDVVRVEAVNDAELVANGLDLACVLRKSERVTCWGEWVAPPGIVAPPAKELREVPLPHPAIEVAVGSYHGCALLSTDEVACWGDNDWGQVGVMRDAASTALPRVLPSLRARHIVADGSVSCAIDLKKRVWCWGWNGGGAMGTGDSEQRVGPVLINAITDAVEIAVHAGRVCAQTAKGDIWCWGGEDESGFSKKTPMPSLRRAPAGQLAAVDEETFSVIEPNGSVYVVNQESSASERVPNLPPVQSLASKNGGACAILVSGELRCWGTNLHGELVVAQKKPTP
jgi:alpha-tubulin suppressor-like RCC1 family protein